jgi:outer membrane receptor protein involved in Fe transport
VGSFFRNVSQQNINVTKNEKLQMSFNNILPVASFNYRINQGSNFSFNYNTSSQQPDLQQMQPVYDNTDPNRISIGNPDLKPTFSQNASLNYYFYKGISDINFWSGGNAGNTDNQISYQTTYDSQGRAVTQPININGNYFANMWFGGGFPVFKKFFKIYYNFNGSFNNSASYVNGRKNNQQTTTFAPGLNFEKNAEKYNVSIGGDYNYNIPKSTISVQSNQPYYSYGLEGSFTVKLPKKFMISSDGKYTNNGNRSPGYNIDYFIWNASLAKVFLKNENLILSLNANDILNQNISNQRTINSNQIVDTKTQIIKRYFLLKVLFKFNNQKTKVEDNDGY